MFCYVTIGLVIICAISMSITSRRNNTRILKQNEIATFQLFMHEPSKCPGRYAVIKAGSTVELP